MPLAASHENAARLGVSGAKGRIGASLCQYLDRPSFVLERYSTQPGADGKFRLTRDLTDPNALRGMDTLIHAAWSTVPVVAEQFPLRIWQTDLPLLAEILDALRHLPREERPFFVFLSSASIYGKYRGECTEDATLARPASWYAFGKLSAERMIAEFAERYDLNCLILRLSNVYGFWNSTVPQGVIPRLVSAALRNEEVEIWGDGSAAKDYIHMDDVCLAIERAIAMKSTGLFNISFARSYSIFELISWVEAATGKVVRRKHVPAFNWDVSQTSIVNRRFVEHFAWHPRITVQEGIDRYARESTKASSGAVGLA